MTTINQDPILVTGVPRSGTSMVAGVIHKCGAFGGKMITDSPRHKKGKFAMYENQVIRDRLVKPYLRQIGVDELGQYPLPDTKKIMKPNDWDAKVKGVMLEEGYNGGPWFYKGAKMILTWPIWADAFPRAKWVIVRRKDDDIVDSCMKTTFMRAFNDREGWYWWIREHKKRIAQMYEATLNIRVIWPEEMIRGNYEDMYELIDWLRLTWKPQEVMKHIEPQLWKQRRKEGIV